MKVEKACEQCSKTYMARVFPSYPVERSKYCSRECQLAAYAEKNTKGDLVKVCEVCGKEFTVDRDHRRTRTCSKECGDALKTAWTKEQASSKVEKVCEKCGKTFTTWPSRKGRYCSRKCSRADVTRRRTGRIFTSELMTCPTCGKEFHEYSSRIKKYFNSFCSRECYLAHNGPSGPEDEVAKWLTSHGIQFESQVRLGRYTIDFLVNGIHYVEVNGCYWHGCIFHGTDLSSIRVQRRIARDERLTEYCLKHNIPLTVIWEHDINEHNFVVLESLLPLTPF